MKVLVIELSNIGDAILTYPALQALWNAFPDGEFHVVAGPRTAGLFSGDRHISRVWLWEKKASFPRQVALIWQLFLCRFDLVVDFRHSLIPLFLGARRTRLIRSLDRGQRHRADEHLSLLKGLGIPTSVQSARLPFGPEEENQVREWFNLTRPVNSNRCIVVAPGARSHLKRWPAERFAAVADRLSEEEKARIFLVGDKQDEGVAQKVQVSMRHPAMNLAGRTTLRELTALLVRTDLLVTNDSACLHAAEAMGIPTVAIFGPTDEKKYGPRNPRSVVARRHLVCAPCERALCPYGHECLQQLDVDEVYSAAVKILRDVRAKSFG